jgi:hypothetical protein
MCFVGKFNQELTYDSGEITITYSDGKSNCHRKYNRTTSITFVCNHAVDGLAGPHWLEETSDCAYRFEWPTKRACPPFKIGDCSIRDSHGQQYDLSSLALPDDNYDYIVPAAKKKYIFNVCRSLVHRQRKFFYVFFLLNISFCS